MVPRETLSKGAWHRNSGMSKNILFLPKVILPGELLSQPESLGIVAFTVKDRHPLAGQPPTQEYLLWAFLPYLSEQCLKPLDCKVLTFVKTSQGPLHLILPSPSFNRLTHIHTIAGRAPQVTNFS